MDLMVGATKDNIMMVEGEMNEVSEQDLIGALKAAHEAIKPMCEMQEELSKACGTDVKREYDDEINDEELREQVRKGTYDACYAEAQSGDNDKKHREETTRRLRSDFTEAYDAAHTELSEDELEEKHAEIDRYFADVQRDSMRAVYLTLASVWMVVQQMRYVLSGARLILCQCHTEVLSSSVVKQCLSLLVLSVQRWTRRWLITFWRRATSASSFTITSLHSVQVRLRLSVV